MHVVWICHYPCHSALAIPHFLSQIRRVRGSLQGENTLLEQLWWANRGLRADFTDQPSTFCSVPLHLASAVLLRSQGVNECQWSGSAPSSSLPSLCLLSTGHCILPGHPALTVCEGASGIFLCVWSVRMVCVWCGMHGVCVCTVQAELSYPAIAGPRPLWKRMTCFSTFPFMLGPNTGRVGSP